MVKTCVLVYNIINYKIESIYDWLGVKHQSKMIHYEDFVKVICHAWFFHGSVPLIILELKLYPS